MDAPNPFKKEQQQPVICEHNWTYQTEYDAYFDNGLYMLQRKCTNCGRREEGGRTESELTDQDKIKEEFNESYADTETNPR